MSRCRHGLTDECRACESRAEERDYESVDPITEADFDALEAGPWFNYAPGMAPREGGW